MFVMRRCVVAFLSATALSVPTAAFAGSGPSPFNWTGFYVGGHAGGGWFSDQLTSVNSNVDFAAGYVHPASYGSGLLGGGYAGFNYQIHRFIIGIDGDYSRSNLTASLLDVGPLSGRTTTKFDQVKWISAVTIRFGYVVDNWMVFAKSGAAWAGFEGTYINPTGTAISSDTRGGWTLGAGIEWSFNAHWSAKLEYDYANFGTASFGTTGVAGASVGNSTPFTAASSLSMIKLGLAYRL